MMEHGEKESVGKFGKQYRNTVDSRSKEPSREIKKIGSLDREFVRSKVPCMLKITGKRTLIDILTKELCYYYLK